MNNKVFIDMISGTLAIPENDKLAIKNRLHSSLQQDVYKPKFRKGTINGRYGNTYSYQLPSQLSGNGFTVEISIFPRCFAHNFFRIKFNPSKMGSSNILLRNLLVDILGLETAQAIFYEIRLTRVDLTIDHETYDDDYFIYMSRASESEIKRGSNGNIESQIAGSKDSNVRVTLYDKTLELNLPDNQGESCNRLEVRVRELGFSMVQITDMLRNHFKKVKFYHNKFIDDEFFDEDFKQQVIKKGINSAMYKMDSNIRRRYLRRLDYYLADPFNLWSLRKSNLIQAVKVLSFLKNKKYKKLN